MSCQHKTRVQCEEDGCQVCSDCGTVLDAVMFDHRQAVSEEGATRGTYSSSAQSGLRRPLPSPAEIRKANARAQDPVALSHTEQVEGRSMVEGESGVGEEGVGLLSFFSAFSGARPHNMKDKVNGRMIDIHQKIMQFSNALGLRNFRDDLRALFIRAMEASNGKYGKMAELILGACICILARQLKKPISLTDVSNATGLTVYELGRYYHRVRMALKITSTELETDPGIFLERYSQGMDLQGKKREVLEGAKQVLSLARSHSLISGRDPELVARAALCLLAEAHLKTKFKQNVSCHTDKKHQQDVIRARFCELRDLLLKLSEQISYLSGITQKNIMENIPEILENYWMLKGRADLKPEALVLENLESAGASKQKQSLPLAPPAFARNFFRQQEWDKKVDKAQRHLQSLFSGGSDDWNEGLDEEELLIQQLLTEEVPLEELKRTPRSKAEMELELSGCRSKKRRTRQSDLDTEELWSDEMSDEEINSYLKSAPEILARQQWDEIEASVSKKQRIM